MFNNASAQNEITAAVRTGSVPAGIAPIAREIAERFDDITGRVAIKAAITAEHRGVISASMVRRQAGAGGVTYEIIRAAINAAEIDE